MPNNRGGVSMKRSLRRTMLLTCVYTLGIFACYTVGQRSAHAVPDAVCPTCQCRAVTAWWSFGFPWPGRAAFVVVPPPPGPGPWCVTRLNYNINQNVFTPNACETPPAVQRGSCDLCWLGQVNKLCGGDSPQEVTWVANAILADSGKPRWVCQNTPLP